MTNTIAVPPPFEWDADDVEKERKNEKTANVVVLHKKHTNLIE